jgi:hypothetical protein
MKNDICFIGTSIKDEYWYLEIMKLIKPLTEKDLKYTHSNIFKKDTNFLLPSHYLSQVQNLNDILEASRSEITVLRTCGDESEEYYDSLKKHSKIFIIWDCNEEDDEDYDDVSDSGILPFKGSAETLAKILSFLV